MAMHRITSSHRFSSSLNRFLIVSALLSVIPGLAIADWILPPDEITYVDTDGGNTQARLIDTDASGTVHLVWVESFSGGIFPPGTKVFYNKKPAGGSFDAAPFLVDVITTNFWVKNASVYASANGDVHVVWQKLVGGDWDIYYRKFQFGVGWGSVETVTSDATSNERPKVVAESNGEIHAIWASTSQIHYKRRDTGTGWDVSSTRLDSTGSASGAHDMTIDQNSTLVAVWS